jgi:hypothetical protein
MWFNLFAEILYGTLEWNVFRNMCFLSYHCSQYGMLGNKGENSLGHCHQKIKQR